MRNIEYEERVIISFEQYRKVLAYYVAKYPDYRILDIENTYFDDEQLSLKNSHKVLRLRKTNGEYELTLKVKGEDGDLEINETPTSHKEIDKALNNEFDKYKPIAKLATSRIEIDIDDYLFVLDMNKYNGIIDYNIEIEASSKEKALSIIMDICKSFDLEYKKDYRSKSSRAIATRKIN